jgi:metal-responsive CopG/Arc/MetJ family transcriptional regulator
MRTTISIEDDVLEAAKELAERERKTLGEVISALARKGLLRKRTSRRTRNGIVLLPVQPGSKPVTPEHVNRLLDELI